MTATWLNNRFTDVNSRDMHMLDDMMVKCDTNVPIIIVFFRSINLHGLPPISLTLRLILTEISYVRPQAQHWDGPLPSRCSLHKSRL